MGTLNDMHVVFGQNFKRKLYIMKVLSGFFWQGGQIPVK